MPTNIKDREQFYAINLKFKSLTLKELIFPELIEDRRVIEDKSLGEFNHDPDSLTVTLLVALLVKDIVGSVGKEAIKWIFEEIKKIVRKKLEKVGIPKKDEKKLFLVGNEKLLVEIHDKKFEVVLNDELEPIHIEEVNRT